MNIIGISAYYHDSAAALISDGEIIAAAQEERFSRKKQDSGFPRNAIQYCLDEAGLSLSEVDYLVFYDKPLLKFERLIETYLAYAPVGFRSFLKAMPVWLKEKLYLKKILARELEMLNDGSDSSLPKILFTEHHQAHAASAFFPSPFKKAAVMCLDGVGEWASSSVWLGEDNTLTPMWEIDFPHSLGLLYSAFTYYAGFKVNSGEYKLMGLAPYGEPVYKDIILNNLIDLKEDGTFRMDMAYFNYATGLTMTNQKFDRLFGGPARKAETDISQREMDIAASIQAVTEEVVLRLAKTVKSEFNVDYLCLAGGVALNCVANGKLLRAGIFKDIWIQPAAGDAGGALGAALAVWYDYLGNQRTVNPNDSMQGSYIGPSYSDEDIENALKSVNANYQHVSDDTLFTKVAGFIDDGNVIGWMQGRMEFGPRALGARSIIGDPRNTKMQTTMNLKIKYRESFRPFAPIVKANRVQDYFQHSGKSPYMLIVAPVNESVRYPITDEQDKLFGIDKLNIPRSELAAVTHVDYSARLQTVHPETNPRLSRLLDAFEDRTGCAVLVNTSFNVRGEPIVNTPEDAWRCFMRTEMDYLIIENFILAKTDQDKIQQDESWKNEFELD
jgi:carbamoyltransferase